MSIRCLAAPARARAVLHVPTRGKARITDQHAEFLRSNRDLGFAVHGSSRRMTIDAQSRL